MKKPKDPACEKPSGMELPSCVEPATHLLNFGCDKAGGAWWLCDVCCVLVVLWLENHWGDYNPVYERKRFAP